MLLLCSDGLTAPALLDAVRFHVAGRRAAALVVTADDQYKDRNYHVPRCSAILEALGLSVTPFDVDERPVADLLAFDVVEFIGGNPFTLLRSLRRAKARPILLTLAQKKLLIGWSAAAFVFGPTLELINRYSPELNTPKLRDLAAMNLTDVQVLPHYSRFLDRFDGFEDICAAYERETGCQVVRLDDGEGAMIHETGDGSLSHFFNQTVEIRNRPLSHFLPVNGVSHAILRLLGKGKGGYSWLAERAGRQYVLKQLHHEPCDYYQFGDKLATEKADYARLVSAGIPVPEMIDTDDARERILKACIPGPTIAELVEGGVMKPEYVAQVRALSDRARAAGLNLDWYPTNFIPHDGTLWYVDYECNAYMEEWSLETWGLQYWKMK